MTAAVTHVIAVLAWMNKDKLDDIKKSVDIQHSRVLDRQGEAALGTNLYREVFLVLEQNNEKKKESMLQLLNAIEAGYRDDEGKQSMRDYLAQLEALFRREPSLAATAGFYMDDAAIPFRSAGERPKQSDVPKAQAQAQVSTSTSSDTGTSVFPGRQDGWDYDIFWCEGSSRNQDLATEIFNGLHKRQVSEKLGRLRLRKLPTSIRQSPGYEIRNQLVIRRHISKDEQAQILRKEISEILGAKFPNIPAIDIDESAQRLPWYLSVFVCL